MATFSLGNSGVTPGAPGVFINERAGALGVTAIAPFSTVYMLVETEEAVPVTRFPFNTPIAITSLNDYKALTAVGVKVVPTERIPLLSYNCVNEFFQNAQVGDLRVVRVGSPNQIVEIELLPSGQKVNNTDLPSNLQAGDKVYIQMEINGIPVVSGDGSTGYDANGEYLGVPVIVPVDYIAGDDVNNRKISAAMAAALATAIETNPAVRSSVYVRSSGLVNDLPGESSTNQNGYVTIAASTFDGDVNVITGVNPVGNQFVFTQGTYEINNIVGGSAALVRTPQDYTQCISTAFDGQQDQGYLITPTAYAQFDAEGRATVGAAAAALCENNSYKWMALADPGPYLVTDINEYSQFSPHEPAEDLIQGVKYLINNVIYEWTGADVSYDRANHQTIQAGSSAQTAVTESVTNVGAGQKMGLLDKATYDAQSQPFGKIQLSNNNWPVTYEIQEVVISGADASTNPFNPYDGSTLYLVAPPKNVRISGDYPLNTVYLCETTTAAQNVLAQVTAAGGSDYLITVPTGALNIAAGAACTISYASPAWDLLVNINGQTSDLIENTTDSAIAINTLHLPATLQAPTNEYRLGFESRTLFNPQTVISKYAGSVATATGAALFTVPEHGLTNSQKLYFTQPVVTTDNTSVTVVKATSKVAQVPYYVTVLSPNTFVLSGSLTAFSAQSYIPFPNLGGVLTTTSVSAGTGGTDGNYNNVALAYTTSGVGSGATANIRVVGGVVTSFTLVNAGTGYTVGNSLTVAAGAIAGLTGFEVTVASVTQLASNPTILYTALLGGTAMSTALTELSIIPAIRGRKYGFSSGSIDNQAANAASIPAASADNPGVSIWLNNSTQILGDEQVVAWGETTDAGWLPKLELVDPGDITDVVANFLCVPTVSQSFSDQSYFVPSIDPINGGEYDAAAAAASGPVTAFGTSIGGGVGGTLGSATVSQVSTTGTGTGAQVVGVVTNTGTTGPIVTLGAVTAGAGTAVSATGTFSQTYPAVATSGGTGSGATVNVTVTQTAGVGPINSLGAVAGGTDAAVGVYPAVAVTGGTGAGATVDVTVTAGPVLAVTLAGAGTGFTAGNTLTIPAAAIGGTVDATVVVTDVVLPVAASAFALNAAGLGYTAGDNLTVAAGAIGGVAGAGVAVATVNAPTGVTSISSVAAGGAGYNIGDTVTFGGVNGSANFTATVSAISTSGGITNATPYSVAAGAINNTSAVQLNQVALRNKLVGVYYTVTSAGFDPSNTTAVTPGDRIIVVSNGTTTSWLVVGPEMPGAVLTLGATSGGTGASNGTYTELTTTTNAAGQGATVNVTVATGVFTVTIADAGYGYAAGNTLTVAAADLPGASADLVITISAATANDRVGDLGAYGQVCYGSSVEISYTEEQVPPVSLWQFDAITSEEIISDALRGVGFNGVPQAVQIETGIDNVSRLLADSQRYGNAFGFIAYYGPYIENGAGQWIPPSPYVSGVALRRYRAEGYQFPPAGTKFQLVDAIAVQIPINSAQQNLLNPEGCNAIRTLPGYPQNAIYIWGGRTRLTNPDDAQQKLYQFVNTRVILNVVYGSLRSAFDSQIFNVIDGFGVVFNQIVNVGNSVLNELYVRGALFGAKPSDAFQVICDERINSANNLENGVVNAKVFVTPVPTLERIQIDLIRVAIGQMQNELNAQGLGQNNSL